MLLLTFRHLDIFVLFSRPNICITFQSKDGCSKELFSPCQCLSLAWSSNCIRTSAHGWILPFDPRICFPSLYHDFHFGKPGMLFGINGTGESVSKCIQQTLFLLLVFKCMSRTKPRDIAGAKERLLWLLCYSFLKAKSS